MKNSVSHHSGLVKPEPKSITIADLVFLVFGAALAFKLIGSVEPMAMHFHIQFLNIAGSCEPVINFMTGIVVAISVVIVSRLWIYRRLPRPAEWLGILVTCVILGDWAWKEDQWLWAVVDRLPRLQLSFGQYRWFMACATAVVILGGLAGLRQTRSIVSTPWRSLILLALAALAIVGPVWVFSEQGADLLSPKGGFGPDFLTLLYYFACLLFAQIPFGVAFGIPIIAIFLERIRRRPWFWTEWSSLGGLIMVVVFLSLSYQRILDDIPIGQFSKLILIFIWLQAVIWISRFVLIQGRPIFLLWIEPPPAQDSSTESASSTL